MKMDCSEWIYATPTKVNHTFALLGKLDHESDDAPGNIFYACITWVEEKKLRFSYFEEYQSLKWKGHNLYTLSDRKSYTFDHVNRAAFLGPAFVQAVSVVRIYIH